MGQGSDLIGENTARQIINNTPGFDESQEPSTQADREAKKKEIERYLM